jgi:hypothetical protein
MLGWLVVLCGGLYLGATTLALYIDGTLTEHDTEGRARAGDRYRARHVRSHSLRSLQSVARGVRRRLVHLPG